MNARMEAPRRCSSCRLEQPTHLFRWVKDHSGRTAGRRSTVCASCDAQLQTWDRKLGKEGLGKKNEAPTRSRRGRPGIARRGSQVS